jgi:hypothetical protein
MLVLTNTTTNQDQTIESSVMQDMFIKGYYQRPNDTNTLIVPISTIKDSINKMNAKAKAKGILNSPVKTYNLK